MKPRRKIRCDFRVFLIFVAIFSFDMYSKDSFGEVSNNDGIRSSSISETIIPRRLQLEHDGIQGFWFRRDVTLSMLADLQEYPLRLQEIRILENALTLRTEQVDRLREMVDLEREAIVQTTEALEIAERRASEAESDRDVWWRRPILWVVVGVVVTIILEVAAVAVLESVLPNR